MTPENILQKYWGYPTFRSGQEDIITSILAKKDTIAILPTGGGKSLCFQVPALMFPGITVVISPLISLMQDQVDALQKRNIAATNITSALSPEESKQRITDLAQSKYKLLYISPEKFISESFATVLHTLDVSLLVVDEAHCISTWGKDFRPSYKTIKNILQKLPYRPPVLAVTATATKQILKDIAEFLLLEKPSLFTSSLERKNLSIQILNTPTTVIKLLFLLEILQKHVHHHGIIYASTRKKTEYICKVLSTLLPHKKIEYYHGGMESKERVTIQNNFISGKTSCIVATNAFGMGVDKPNIYFVVHYDTPISVENYSQEIGRAGRDGQPSCCYTFYCESDQKDQLDFQTKEKPVAQQKQIQKQAEYMRAILLTKSCKSKKLSAYFNSQIANCNTCSSCLSKHHLQQSLTKAIEPELFLALKKIRSKQGSALPPVSAKILATLTNKNIAVDSIPGIGSAFNSVKSDISHLMPEENDKILS